VLSKNILLISAVFPPEPVVSAKLSFDIANSLSERNTVTVISPIPSRPFGFKFNRVNTSFSFNHIQVTSYVCASSSIIGRFRESYSFGKFSSRFINDNHQNIDVIYANTWQLMGQYLVVKAARKYNIPVVIHVQDIYPESLANKLPVGSSLINYLLMPLDKYILGKSNKVIAISKKMKDYLAETRKLNKEKIEIIPNWQGEESFQNIFTTKNNITDSPFTFMYLGNIGPVAGVDLLLDAFVLANIQNSRLVIAGSGSMKEVLEKQAENYSAYNIEFWLVPEGKVPEMQAMADILILPVRKGSASTSIPSKLPAYMFSAKPIIACVDKDSDTATTIKEAKCGWVIQPDNIVILSDKMVDTAKMNENLLSELGNNGRNYALMHLSKKKNLPIIVKIIEEAVL
jgi:glycosyltransferase involved in cell wall biosynthesis